MIAGWPSTVQGKPWTLAQTATAQTNDSSATPAASQPMTLLSPSAGAMLARIRCWWTHQDYWEWFPVYHSYDVICRKCGLSRRIYD